MGGISNQSPAVLKKTSGAANVGTSSGDTVQAFLNALFSGLSQAGIDIDAIETALTGYLLKSGGTLTGSIIMPYGHPLQTIDSTMIAYHNLFGLGSWNGSDQSIEINPSNSIIGALRLNACPGYSGALSVNRVDVATWNSSGIALSNGVRVLGILDEDGMESNSAIQICTQQSIKAYVDNSIDALPESGVVLLASDTLSGDTYVDIVLPTGYDEFIIELQEVWGNDDAFLRLRTSSDSGATFYSGAAAYGARQWHHAGSTEADATYIPICYETGGSGIGATGNENGLSGTIKLYNPRGLTYAQIVADVDYKTSSAGNGLLNVRTGGRRLGYEGVNAVRLYMSAGTFMTGLVALYGVKR